MPAAPALSPLVPAPAAPGRLGPAILGRSTASVRLRYRRQTAALMIGTTVVGLWLGLAAPAVSPVTPTTDVVVSAVTDQGSTLGAFDQTRGHHGGHRG